MLPWCFQSDREARRVLAGELEDLPPLLHLGERSWRVDHEYRAVGERQGEAYRIFEFGERTVSPYAKNSVHGTDRHTGATCSLRQFLRIMLEQPWCEQKLYAIGTSFGDELETTLQG
jgi:hypothetical protein